MVVLAVQYRAKAGNGDAVAAALQTMQPLIMQREPGCLLFHVCRSHDESDVFLLYEHYVNDAALAAHRESDHFQHYVLTTIVPLLESREVQRYDLVMS